MDFEAASEYSERLDNIINVKSGDPRKVKDEKVAEEAKKATAKGKRRDPKSAVPKESTKVPAFGNVDFYR